MAEVLSRDGLQVSVLKADTVPPDRREAWVAQKVEEGIDVLICHPRLVQTGLDLIYFPTIVWGEVDYSVYTMRQASRRIGQKHPVKVVFMAYRNSLQADALKLVAKKLQSSLAVKGELPEDGLAAYGDDDDGLMMALTRQNISGEEDEESVEAVFARSRNAKSVSEELLVEDGWHAVEAEPEVVDVHRNGAGVTVEEATNGHAAEPQEARGTQRSLFSWAEFMAEEPVEPQGRSGKAKPSSLSLFEWALVSKREREEEPAGAGR